jgi:hypothetical protein
MQFKAKCAASISKNHKKNWVLIKLEEDEGELHGQIAKALGELEPDATYEITIRKVSMINV